jgi:hypothetical protein
VRSMADKVESEMIAAERLARRQRAEAEARRRLGWEKETA